MSNKDLLPQEISDEHVSDEHVSDEHTPLPLHADEETGHLSAEECEERLEAFIADLPRNQPMTAKQEEILRRRSMLHK